MAEGPQAEIRTAVAKGAAAWTRVSSEGAFAGATHEVRPSHPGGVKGKYHSSRGGQDVFPHAHCARALVRRRLPEDGRLVDGEGFVRLDEQRARSARCCSGTLDLEPEPAWSASGSTYVPTPTALCADPIFTL